MIANFIEGLTKYELFAKLLISHLSYSGNCVWSPIGCFIILRGMSLMGDCNISCCFPGVAVLLS